MSAYLGDQGVSEAEEDFARQRDCIDPAAEYFLRAVATLPGLRGKVLLTTRLRPRALETRGGDLLRGCREVELRGLSEADAVAYFLARGVQGTRAEIAAVAARYGHHPLSLALVAGLVVKDPRTPGDIRAAERLDVTGDLVQRRHHVLQAAYESLTPARQRLLGYIACFRGPVGYDALQAVAEEGEDLDADLRDLMARGLLHHDPTTNRYDLHPIVRRYAYDRLTGDARTAAHARLRDYFAAVPEPERVQTLDDLAPVIERYHHTVRAGRYDEAFALLRDRLGDPIYYQFGAYRLYTELLRALFPDGEDNPPRRAIPLFERHNRLREKAGDKKNLAIGLVNLADDQMKIGALRAAEANLRRSIALCREIEDKGREAVCHQERGRLLAYRGRWAEAEEELKAALSIFEERHHPQAQGLIWAYYTLLALMRWRQTPSTQFAREVLTLAQRTLELADAWASTRYSMERNYVRAHWLLGAAHRVNGNLDEAGRHLNEALRRCRAINAVDAEADILLELARLRYAQGHAQEAEGLAREALTITERSGYVLQGADVHLFLARMALDSGDRVAREHAQQALKLATCDGPPDYTYKVAYDEARTMLETLK